MCTLPLRASSVMSRVNLAIVSPGGMASGFTQGFSWPGLPHPPNWPGGPFHGPWLPLPLPLLSMRE